MFKNPGKKNLLFNTITLATNQTFHNLNKRRNRTIAVFHPLPKIVKVVRWVI